MNRPGECALVSFSLEFLLFVVLLRYSNTDWSLCAMNPFHVSASRRQRCRPTVLGEEENFLSDFPDPIVVFPHYVHPRSYSRL
jgi:hypothetical protein